jgi:hypothetical protein
VDKARLEGTALAFSGAGFAFAGRIEAGRLAGEIDRNGRRQALVFER